MAQHSRPLLLVALAFLGAILLFGGASATTTGHKVNGVGAWVNDDLYLQELGQYAVASYNLLSQQQLTFQKVISCDYLPGLNNKLTIAATDGGVTKTYEAVVFYKPWIQFKKLVSFKLS